eukprot:3368706-Prymnesium_polylepis.3
MTVSRTCIKPGDAPPPAVLPSYSPQSSSSPISFRIPTTAVFSSTIGGQDVYTYVFDWLASVESACSANPALCASPTEYAGMPSFPAYSAPSCTDETTCSCTADVLEYSPPSLRSLVGVLAGVLDTSANTANTASCTLSVLANTTNTVPEPR